MKKETIRYIFWVLLTFTAFVVSFGYDIKTVGSGILLGSWIAFTWMFFRTKQ